MQAWLRPAARSQTGRPAHGQTHSLPLPRKPCSMARNGEQLWRPWAIPGPDQVALRKTALFQTPPWKGCRWSANLRKQLCVCNRGVSRQEHDVSRGMGQDGTVRRGQTLDRQPKKGSIARRKPGGLKITVPQPAPFGSRLRNSLIGVSKSSIHFGAPNATTEFTCD